MRIFNSIQSWREFRKTALTNTETLGFVPTMGNLHEGHRSLLIRSCAENTKTALSIFINPTQFNNPKDLEKYPRTLLEDQKMAQTVGVDYLLLPEISEIYPDNYRYQIIEKEKSKVLEGNHRQGHFEGVLTVVMKLLMLVRPNRSYFGEKDFQQLELVRDMTKAFFLETEIIACPTIRNSQGLALSSRNNLLSSQELEFAQKFPNILRNAKDSQQAILQLRAAGFIVEYVEEIDNRRFAAIRIGNIRLIDNILMPQEITEC